MPAPHWQSFVFDEPRRPMTHSLEELCAEIDADMNRRIQAARTAQEQNIWLREKLRLKRAVLTLVHEQQQETQTC
jgi:hypothetical protein